ncbi:MAG: hypothetical protein RMK29_20550 [Myxococcales bacterium]|nr:hypothetical protein [Myxococcota bacterium]MDW8284102.1 hypothetical protein [Myxococcales bacterium]
MGVLSADGELPSSASPARRALFWLIQRLSDTLAQVGVMGVLGGLWAVMLVLTYDAVVVPLLEHPPHWLLLATDRGGLRRLSPSDPTVALAWGVLGVCALPYVLSLCVAVLIRRRWPRARYQLVIEELPDEGDWDDLLHRVKMQWETDALRAREGVEQVLPFAAFFGFVTSVTLGACAILLGRALHLAGGTQPPQLDDLLASPRYGMAVTVAAAAGASFMINLGRILVRTARQDASARLFAWAARAQLLLVVASVLGISVLMHSGEVPVRTAQGFVGIGVALALFGERVLQGLADRAARAMGLPQMRVQSASDLHLVEGLSEEDMVRLSEEGVDCIHALALASTARLYFGTTFSLRRIVGWQDQALLHVLCGPRAQQFREQFVRGAIAAQRLAEQVVSAWPEAEHLEDLCMRLGFPSLREAQVALRPLAEDDAVRALRLYARASVRRLTDRS